MFFNAPVEGGKTANANGVDKGNEQVQVYDSTENSNVFRRLNNVMTSMLHNQDFSSYSMENLEVAKVWFLNPSNHPIGKSSIHKRSEADSSNDKYMKERFTLALLYFSNCKENCKLPASEWLSTSDHCQWTGIQCNSQQEITVIKLRNMGLSNEFTLLELDSLQKMDLRKNNLSGTFTIAGGYVFSMTSLKNLNLARNHLNNVVGLQLLKNLRYLSLFQNEFEGEFEISDETFPVKIKWLNLSRNRITGIKGAQILRHLQSVSLAANRLKEGDFVITQGTFPTNLKKLNLYGNNFDNVEALQLQHLTKLRALRLSGNVFEGKLIITKDTLPLSLQTLILNGNKLKSIQGLQYLTSLRDLRLSKNAFKGPFAINEDFAPPYLESLDLSRNLITSTDGLQNLHMLKTLLLSSNKFEGEFLITTENYPINLQTLSLNNNGALKNVIGENGAVPFLQKLNLVGIDSVSVNIELCHRKELDISPEDVCDCKTVEEFESNGSALENIIADMVQNQDFSSYCEKDFNNAKAWFTDAANHPYEAAETDKPYMKERFTLALLHFANCKEECSLTPDTGWLSKIDHCQWKGITCNEDYVITSKNLSEVGLSEDFTLFELTQLEDLNLRDNLLSGIFVVAGGNSFSMSVLRNINLMDNMFTGIEGASVLTHPKEVNLDLQNNNLEGELIITTDAFPRNLQSLYLYGNQLTSIIDGQLLVDLKRLYLSYNRLSGIFVIEENKFPMHLTTLSLDTNHLKGIEGVQYLKNLRTLYLDRNKFEGEFVIAKDTFPVDVMDNLSLGQNQLTSIRGAQLLTKLNYLRLNNNQISGNFEINENNFPVNIGENLDLDGNELTSISGFELLTNLDRLGLEFNNLPEQFQITPDNLPLNLLYLGLGGNGLKSIAGLELLAKLDHISLITNDFSGVFTITKDNFPENLKSLYLSNNPGLTGINIADDAIPKLEEIDLFGMDGIDINQGFCDRNVLITPENVDVCNA